MIYYKSMNEENLGEAVKAYVNYYNTYEDGCWKMDNAYKRIHQIYSMEDSMCLLQYEKNQFIGFVIGCYKEYDDLCIYYLEEIVILHDYQSKGYGTKLIEEIERRNKEKGVTHMDLTSVNDSHHIHFYEKLGFKKCNNLLLYSKIGE